MIKLFKLNYFKILIFLIVFGFTFILRAHNYDRVPTFGHLEELLYGWSGIYLVETGVPVSWSTLDYPKKAEIYRGKISYQGGEPHTYVTIYKPWLDEPPVFSVLVGYSAHFFKADRNDVLPTSYLRFPVIFISALTSIMVFLIAKKISNFWAGISSMLIYGTVPIFVISSRMAVPENLIAFLFMVTIYLLLQFKIKPKFIYLLPIPIIVGIAGLSKPTGFFLLPIALLFAFWEKFYKSCVYLILATLPFILIFIAYGLYYDPEIFWRILSIQGYRPVGFSSLGWFFTSPAFDINILTESWYIFGLLSAAYFIFKPERGLKRYISLFFVYWIIIVMLSGGEGDLLPWYRYPAFPLMAIFITWGLRVLIKRADFFASFLVFGLLLGGRHLLVNAFHPNVSPANYRVIFFALMLPSTIKLIFDNNILKRICQVLIILTIVVGIYMNSKFIYSQYDLECESKTCPMGPSTQLSTIYFPIFWRFFVI